MPLNFNFVIESIFPAGLNILYKIIFFPAGKILFFPHVFFLTREGEKGKIKIITIFLKQMDILLHQIIVFSNEVKLSGLK